MDPVRDQYNELPYPPRVPADEQWRLKSHGYIYGFDRISDLCFGGMLDVRNGVRVLVAGGGTGDAVVSMGEQLRDTPSEIVYLDLSASALEVARSRAEMRSIPNIQWRLGSLLDVNEAETGTFDYIDSVGVLHHLEDPRAGFRALSRVLRPDGAMGAMVYGKYGRAGIYEARNRIETLLRPGMTRREQVAVARRFLAENPRYDPGIDVYGSGEIADAGIYDWFLHERDRHPFTVPMLNECLEAAGLNLISFVDPRSGGKFGYVPHRYAKRSAHHTLAALPRYARQAVAERLSGKISLHAFYASRRTHTAASSGDPTMVPSFSMGITAALRGKILERIIGASDRHLPVAVLPGGRKIRITPGYHAPALFQYLDGQRTNQEIAALAAERLATDRPLEQELARLLNLLRAAGWITLRHRNTPPFKAAETLQRQQLVRQGTPDREVVVDDMGATIIKELLGQEAE